ncbi:hypothetical protein [Mesonia aquimarina]|uniref:hypothetical protein n=1 Tax=Mesonia aquimarina TaxID=1504967 RepID=UPI000EF62B2B|nr:hypothetical protein [Mesonia aquimarina]
MFTEKDKKRLKKIFPHRYGSFIEAQLLREGITQLNGKPFKNQSIKLCIKGKRPNLYLEEAIEKIAEKVKNKELVTLNSTHNAKQPRS